MDFSRETRQDLLDYVLGQEEAFHGDLELLSFLKRIWDLDNMRSTDHRFSNAAGDISQHMVNNDDWDDDYLLINRLNLLNSKFAIFKLFLETYVHPYAIKSEDLQKKRVKDINQLLKSDDFVLELDDSKPGLRRYKIHSFSGNLEYPYQVVLSYASEQEEYVREVAKNLKRYNISVFFDKFEQVTLWGKDLVEHFHKVFSDMGRYCVIFISRQYKNKMWTRQERRFALERALREREEYILPVRFDDADIPGISQNIGYIDLRDGSIDPSQLVELIVQKLGVVI